MKKIIIFLGLFVLAGAFSIAGQWPTIHGAVVLPRPDLAATTSPTPAPAGTAVVHKSYIARPAPTVLGTPVPDPSSRPMSTPPIGPPPSPVISPTPLPSVTPIPGPPTGCSTCGGFRKGAGMMCPMIACPVE